MSIVSESKPWCDITSAENALGMDSHPFTTASPLAQISFSALARTTGSSRPPRDGTGCGRADYTSGLRREASHQQVPSIARVGADLGRPAALLDGLGPGIAQQHLGALELV